MNQEIVNIFNYNYFNGEIMFSTHYYKDHIVHRYWNNNGKLAQYSYRNIIIGTSFSAIEGEYLEL